MLERVREWPPVRWLRARRYERSFWLSNKVLHKGVYASFDEALAAIPRGRSVGWDHEAPAGLFKGLTEHVNPRDYPVLYWLQTLWRGKVSVVDYGGHIGTKRYAFERYLAFDDSKHWTVCEVPRIVEAGRQYAAQRRPTNLAFTTDFDAAAGADVLLCLGVIQFLDVDFAEKLRALARLPPHIIVNGLPLHDRLAFYTVVNNMGTGFMPYRIPQRGQFVASLEALGYELVDSWQNPERQCVIPLHEEHAVEGYSGFYFRLRERADPNRPS